MCHRDIKAENFMLANSGDESHIKLIDFGLARWGLKTDEKLHQKIGTPEYMAPELFKGCYSGAQCDDWAIGILMYFLISGQLAFTDPSLEKL